MSLNLAEGGEPVAGYRLVRALGRGGFGEVWEARAPGGVRVALKFIRLGTTEAGFEQRALEVIRDIRHPHLLDVQFAARVDDCLVIAMPLCERSLMDRLQECQKQGRDGLPREELLRYLGELAPAIDFLNEPRHPGEDGKKVGVQHRDIKPHNVFLVGGSVRLADFGLAKVLAASLASHTGSMSPHYVAPELIEGTVSRWSDQYSLAVSYAQLRTGRLPFRGETVGQVLNAHLHHPPDLSGLPEPERRVVARALAKKPDERWPNCRAFVQALEASEAVPTTDPGTIPPGTEGSSPRPESFADERLWAVGASESKASRRPWRRIAGLLTALAVLAALVVLIATTWLRPVVRPDRGAEGGSAANPVAIAAAAPGRPETPPGADERAPEVEPNPLPTSVAPPTKKPDLGLARPAQAFLKRYCYDCHGGANDVGEDLNVADRDVLLRQPESKKKLPYVVPGNPGESLLWEYAGIPSESGKYRMPKKGAPQPTPEERKVLEQWIASGAEFPRDVERTPVDDRAVVGAIREHLKRLNAADRPFQRYLTLHHLHNNPTVDGDALRVHRAAVAKLINSLSWQPEIVSPKAIDGEAEVILSLDLRKVGWDARDWKAIARVYPYGVTHTEDESFQELEREVAKLTGTRLPALRADWFVATASRPPLYDQLLRLPASLRELEEKLSVRLETNFARDILRRGGLISSGVSRHNRLVERHPTPFGAYWRSYDFASSAGQGNLLLFPLGPKFPGNPFDDQAFVQAGGEVIFHLPNGLQGYMLAKADDTRLDGPAPVAIVRDRDEISGTPEVVNGISCLACHKNGMKTFQDEVRTHPAVFGDAKAKLLRLYSPTAEMDALLAKDEERFLRALDTAIGPFLRAGDDARKDVRDFIEPIGEVARGYDKDLTPDAVAAELGLAGVAALQGVIQGNPKLQELGLGPLLDAKAVKRELWEGRGVGLSLFHQVAIELGLARTQDL
jgi:serine/threonine-protein kinase